MFNAAMQAAEKTGPHSGSWFVEPDRVAARPGARSRARGLRRDTTSARAIIVSSAFLALLTAALMVGGHLAVDAAIDPLLRPTMAPRDTIAVGDVVLPMADRRYCRHMSFDNATAEMVEGTIERCPDNLGSSGRHTGRGFTWGEQ